MAALQNQNEHEPLCGGDRVTRVTKIFKTRSANDTAFSPYCPLGGISIQETCASGRGASTSWQTLIDKISNLSQKSKVIMTQLSEWWVHHFPSTEPNCNPTETRSVIFQNTEEQVRVTMDTTNK